MTIEAGMSLKTKQVVVMLLWFRAVAPVLAPACIFKELEGSRGQASAQMQQAVR